jgi:hypothetical protein
VLLCEEYVGHRSALLIYLASNLHDAINDSFFGLGPEPARLYDRIIGWARDATKTWRPPNGTDAPARVGRVT